MTFSLDISLQRLSVREPNTGDFPLGGVGLLWLCDEYLGADALLLRVGLEEWCSGETNLLWLALRAHGLV